jgi:hypothetical protein
MTQPEDLQPGKVYPLSIDLHLASWVFPTGHRVRISVSNALWPMMWPTPFSMTTSLDMGGAQASRVVLPQIPLHGARTAALAAPERVEKPSGISGGSYDWPGDWTVLRDEAQQRSTVVWQGKSAATYPWGPSDYAERLTYEVTDAHPDTARVHGDSEYHQSVSGHVLTWRGRLEVSSDAHTFFYKYTRTLLRDGQVVRTKSWDEQIPRDHQ